MLGTDRDLKLYRTLSLVPDSNGVGQAGNNPLVLEDVKKSLRVDHDDDDATIMALMDAALACFEGRDGQLGRALLTQKWELRQARFARWPYYYGQENARVFDRIYDPTQWLAWNAIEIPLPPLQSIDSVQYYDGDGTLQTLDPSAYITEVGGIGMWYMLPAPGTSWPACDPRRRDAARIKFTAGYASTAALKAERKTILQAMTLLVGLWYENREAALVADRAAAVELPWGISSLIAPHVVRWL